MADETNARPVGIPKVPGRIVDGMRKAVADPASRSRAYVRLSVSGGVHGEEYEFEYLVDASGNTTGHMRDELSGRRGSARPEAQRQVDPQRFKSLVEAIDVDALVRADYAAGGFPPDSVVGRLELSDGEQAVSFTFLADDNQAARSEIRMPEPLRTAVDAVYRAAAADFGQDNVKP